METLHSKERFDRAIMLGDEMLFRLLDTEKKVEEGTYPCEELVRYRELPRGERGKRSCGGADTRCH